MQSLQHSRQSREGLAAIEAAQAAGATIHTGIELWGVFPGHRLCCLTNDAPLEVTARAIVVATGAHDRVMPFPGWTLPGVMTPGAGQRMAKLARTPAGRRVVLAGSGPFLLAVAKALNDIGAPPVALIEARRLPLGALTHLLLHPDRWREAATLVAGLRAIRQRLSGWVVTEALGTRHLEAVRIAPLTPDGRADSARTVTVPDIEGLLVGWGFRPSIEVTSILRCAHSYDRAAGGWFCAIDHLTGATSVDAVYAAGEVTGVGGARPAQASGTLAGLSAAAGLGFAPAWLKPERDTALADLRKAREFANVLNRLYVPPAHLAELASPDTIVCRCEEVTRREIVEALQAGAKGVQGVKYWTRAGMGPCQGRICGWAVAEIAAQACGHTAEQSGTNSPRIPLRPVPLKVVLEATEDAGAMP